MIRILPFWTILLVVILVSGVSGQLLVCPKCKHESEPAGAFCTHCGAALRGDERQSPARTGTPPVSETDSGGRAPGPEMVEEDLSHAMEALAKDAPWIAFLYTQNAMALNMICTGGTNLSERIMNLYNVCEQQIRPAQRRCVFCKGQGKFQRTVESVGVDGKTISHRETDVTCQICKGAGTVHGQADQSALVSGYTKAIKQYGLQRTARKWIQLGNAWIPADIENSLTMAQVVSVRRVAGGTCPNCIGFGKTTCALCEGTGKTKCKASNCKEGIVTKRMAGAISRSTYGLKKQACEKCEGTGMEKCAACRGQAYTACASCNGTGKLPACTLCKGKGLTECDKCGGTGLVEEKTCPSCNGKARQFCRLCDGDGRSSQVPAKSSK